MNIYIKAFIIRLIAKLETVVVHGFFSICKQSHYYNLESILQSQPTKSFQLSILKFYLK